MVSLADLEVPDDLTCATCGDPVAGGYVPATDDGEGGLEVGSAVCEVCGWTEVGASGCAPTLSDVGSGDALVRVEAESGGLVPAAITDER